MCSAYKQMIIDAVSIFFPFITAITLLASQLKEDWCPVPA